MSDDEIEWGRVIGELAGDQLRGNKPLNQLRRDRALSLLQQCHDENVAPPTELIDLIAVFIGDDRRNTLPSDKDMQAAGLGRVGSGREAEYIMRLLASEYDVPPGQYPKLVAAAKYEAEHDVDPTGEKPSQATKAGIADEAGIARATVSSYQKKEKYRELVIKYRAELAGGVNVP
ncbi:MAG: hypothetical protein ISR45_02660 [Rhodospirillales bacterium]|nr:hypothetical protein [Rhodospirillales bacterium]